MTAEKTPPRLAFASGDEVDDARSRAAARNTAALLTSRVAISAMGWAGSIVVARLLSPTQWGQYSFVFGLLGLLGILTDLGVGRVVLARLVDERDPDVPQVASAFIALRVVLGLFGYVAGLAYVVLLHYPGQVVRATAVAGIVVVLATPSHALTMIFQSRLRMSLIAAAETLAQVVQLALTLLAALFAPLLLIFILPVIANEVVTLTLKVRALRRGIGLRPARQVQLWRWRGMLLDAVPLAIGTALATLLYKVDVLLLSQLDSFDSVGLYTIGYKFADVLAVVTSAVIGPAMTLLMSHWPGSPERFRERSRQTALALALLASLALTGFWAIARPLVTLLYGERFGAAVLSTRLLLLGACFTMIAQVGFNLLVASGRQRLYPLVGVVGLAINVGLNLVLIPRASFTGAAVATLITEALVLVVMWVLVVRSLRVPGLLPLGRLAAVAAATAGIVLASEVFAPIVPWPLLGAASSAAALATGYALDLPGARAVVALVRSRVATSRDVA